MWRLWRMMTKKLFNFGAHDAIWWYCNQLDIRFPHDSRSSFPNSAQITIWSICTSQLKTNSFPTFDITYVFLMSRLLDNLKSAETWSKKMCYVYCHIILLFKPLDVNVMLSGSNGNDKNNHNLNTLYTIDESSQNHLEDHHCIQACLKIGTFKTHGLSPLFLFNAPICRNVQISKRSFSIETLVSWCSHQNICAGCKNQTSPPHKS